MLKSLKDYVRGTQKVKPAKFNVKYILAVKKQNSNNRAGVHSHHLG
jgi:hypothetical protein